MDEEDDAVAADKDKSTNLTNCPCLALLRRVVDSTVGIDTTHERKNKATGNCQTKEAQELWPGEAEFGKSKRGAGEAEAHAYQNLISKTTKIPKMKVGIDGVERRIGCGKLSRKSTHTVWRKPVVHSNNGAIPADSRANAVEIRVALGCDSFSAVTNEAPPAIRTVGLQGEGDKRVSRAEPNKEKQAR